MVMTGKPKHNANRPKHAPSYDALRDDLRAVRRVGVGRLRGLSLPALRQATVLLGLCESEDTAPASLVALLREATSQLGGGKEQDAAEALLGLAPGMAMRESGERRQKAASHYGIVAETFRKKPEADLIDYLAETILGICHEAHLRGARLEMEHHRHPADSRLAVEWVARFESYSRIWTSLWALAAELQAAVEALHEPAADYPPWDPKGLEKESQRIAACGGYDPSKQSRGYARSALYRYVEFNLGLKRFLARHGGLFLFSSTEIEEQVADAIYLISWHTPGNEQANAWLRRTLADSRHQEQDHFERLLSSSPDGEYLLDRWYEFVEQCSCEDLKHGDLKDDQTVPDCDLHATIHYCHTYCDLIDQEWLKIADWYHLDSKPPRGAQPGELYDRSVKRARTQE